MRIQNIENQRNLKVKKNLQKNLQIMKKQLESQHHLKKYYQI